jgi:thymidylate synthase (FAD)
MTGSYFEGSVSVLDHGYVRGVEFWGSDERIIEAARMSTGKGFQGWGPFRKCSDCGALYPPGGAVPFPCGHSRWQDNVPGDEKLLKYLYEHKHHTPFEMAGLTVEIKAPIMVFREWHRHRTQSYNEMSARYTPLPDENYVPTIERCMVNAGRNKQAGAAAGAGELDRASAETWLSMLDHAYRTCQEVYTAGLGYGIPKELARLCVPVGRYSKMRASANLRNWLAFLTLRSAPDAQYEIRVYAEEVGNLIARQFPQTWELFTLGRK